MIVPPSTMISLAALTPFEEYVVLLELPEPEESYTQSPAIVVPETLVKR